MAELNTPEPKGKGDKKIRSKKMNSSVDLTAMVDLAFLLITFFMLTTTLSKPQSMPLAMPDTSEKPEPGQETRVAEHRTVTLVLGTHNQLVWYLGNTPGVDAKGKEVKAIEGPEVTGYGKDGIRKVLLAKKQQIQAQYAASDSTKNLTVIIKASEKSTYRNLVDALDEMAITQVKTYAIVDITPADTTLLGKNGLNN